MKILYGFPVKEWDRRSQPDSVGKIWSDNRFIAVIEKLSERYPDLFIWYGFVDMYDYQAAWLDYTYNVVPNSGIEIQFSVWENHVKDVHLLTYCRQYQNVPGSTDSEYEWKFSKVSVGKIVKELFRLIDDHLVFLNGVRV